MSDKPKVVNLNRSSYRHVAETLRRIAEDIEAGAFEEPDTCAIVMCGLGQPVQVFGLGPQADDMHTLGALQVGQHSLIQGKLEETG